MTTLGSVELGGTKVLAAAVSRTERIREPWRTPTGDPEPTIDRICRFLEPHNVNAIGVATFGPVELRRGHPRFGTITTTPKAAWRGFDLLTSLSERLSVPIELDTDVNGSALGEWKWGALKGVDTAVYLTVGTGIGGSLLINGNAVGGVSHPEMGHLVVERHPDDDFEGGCPYHGGCLEGMASGPSIAARFGNDAPRLDREIASTALEFVSHYVAQGLRDVVYTVAPERIVIGGGVSKLPGFHIAVSQKLQEQLAGYPGLDLSIAGGYLTPPGLGDLSGVEGGLVLAERALS